jgi:hypothetical protein
VRWEQGAGELTTDLDYRIRWGEYLTVDPQDRRIAVSKRINEEFENRKDYYKLEGLSLR